MLELAGAVSIEIGGNIAPFEAALSRARQMAEGFDAQISAKLSGSASAGMAKIAASVNQTNAMLEKLVSSSMEGNAALTKLNATAQATNDALMKLGSGSARAASQNLTAVNTSATTGTVVIERLNKAVNDNTKAFSLNRGGMMELRAAGVNTFQALAAGMSPLQVAMMEGSQVIGAFVQGAEGGLKALGSFAFAAIVNPLGGVVAATAAAIAGIAGYALYSTRDIKSVDDVLKEHTAAIRSIKDAYGEAISGAQAYASEGRNSVSLTATKTVNDLRLTLAKATQDAFNQFQVHTGGGAAGNQFGPANFVGSEFKPFTDAINYLQQTIEKGTPDIIGFRRMVTDRWALDPNNKALTDTADKLQKMTDSAVGAAQALQELDAARKKLAENIGPNGQLKASGNLAQDDMGNYSAFLSQQAVAAKRALEAFQADVASINAKSPADKAAAARAQAAASYPTDETAAQRQQRIQLAGERAMVEAEQALKDAQDQRVRSYQQTLASAQLDLSLIGKTTGEVTEQQQAFQMLSALRQEAAQNGITTEAEFQKYYGAETEQVKKLAAELGKLAEARAQAQLTADLAFSRDQLFRSPIDQQIASTQHSAGLPIDMNSPQAKEMRAQADIGNIHDAIGTFFSTFTQEAETKGTSVGKALMDAVQAGVLSELNSLIKGLTDQLTAWLTKALSDAAGLGGPAANDNYGVGAVIKAALPSVGAANQNLPQSMTAFASAIKSIESGGNYSALGPVLASGDRAYGAYQVMGANIGPWTKQAFGVPWTPSQFLASPSGQDVVFAQQFGSYVNRFGPSGAAQAWFGGPGSVGGSGMGSDILGTTGQAYVDQFNANLKSMAGTAASATQGLSTFGTGASQIGNSMQQAAASASSGGGGLTGWLGKLFGFGGSNIFPAAPTGVPINDLTPADYGFAAGTPSAPPGWAWVGERGPELMRFHGGETVVPSHVSMRVARGYADGTPGYGGAIANQNGAPVIQIIDNAGVKKTTQRSKGPNGQDVVKIVLDAVKSDYADGGFDDLNSTLYGVQRNGTRR